mmetsp:Transcript_69521/g.193432  ORF Transcript_69521/g.193432 Transcript_69521/m.193432 type:complete len:341 (-) Transcript_69521:318-1340(-)
MSFFVAGAVVAGVSAVFCVLLFSPRAQSLIVFAQWLNWPPFSWAAPEAPSASWAWPVSHLFGRLDWSFVAFRGLTGVKPFTAKGSMGTIRGWRIPRTGPGNRTVIYLHGNAGNVAVHHRVLLYQLLTAKPLACDVVVFDYAGFGKSDGWWPDEESCLADALAVWKTLQAEDDDVILWGHSLGTGVAIDLIAALVGHRGPGVDALGGVHPVGSTPLLDVGGLPHGLILEAPFLSVPDVAASFVGWLPRRFVRGLTSLLHGALKTHKFPAVDRIGEVARHMQNIAVLHGLRDNVVPHAQGKRIAEVAGVPLHSFDRKHDDIVSDPGLVEILESLFETWDSRP